MQCAFFVGALMHIELVYLAELVYNRVRMLV